MNEQRLTRLLRSKVQAPGRRGWRCPDETLLAAVRGPRPSGRGSEPGRIASGRLRRVPGAGRIPGAAAFRRSAGRARRGGSRQDPRRLGARQVASAGPPLGNGSRGCGVCRPRRGSSIRTARSAEGPQDAPGAHQRTRRAGRGRPAERESSRPGFRGSVCRTGAASSPTGRSDAATRPHVPERRVRLRDRVPRHERDAAASRPRDPLASRPGGVVLRGRSRGRRRHRPLAVTG